MTGEADRLLTLTSDVADVRTIAVFDTRWPAVKLRFLVAGRAVPRGKITSPPDAVARDAVTATETSVPPATGSLTSTVERAGTTVPTSWPTGSGW